MTDTVQQLTVERRIVDVQIFQFCYWQIHKHLATSCLSDNFVNLHYSSWATAHSDGRLLPCLQTTSCKYKIQIDTNGNVQTTEQNYQPFKWRTKYNFHSQFRSYWKIEACAVLTFAKISFPKQTLLVFCLINNSGLEVGLELVYT